MSPKFHFLVTRKTCGNIVQTPKNTSLSGMTRFEPSLVQIQIVV